VTQPDAEPVGSAAEEAVKLLRALQGETSDDDTAHACPAPWCPVCQVAGFVREHPEAVAEVAQAATALARSVRDLLTTVTTTSREES
jgi:hypothetical protein